MNPEAHRLLDLMKRLAPDRSVSPEEHNVVHVYQTRYMAKLMVVLAEGTREGVREGGAVEHSAYHADRHTH